MGNKKKRGPTVEEVLEKPWCYYCERDFLDNKVLIDHQKAKHFSCPSCSRKLNTAGGLSVHMHQVHKDTLTHIANAIEGRQNVEPEIFGMMGIPDEILDAHKQRILNEFFKVEAERRAITGNPPPGQNSGQPAAKKRKVETKEELKARLAEFRANKGANGAQRKAGEEAIKEGNPPASSEAPAQTSTQTPAAPAPASEPSPAAYVSRDQSASDVSRIYY